MQKIANFVVKKKYIVITAYILLIIYSIFGVSRLQVNSDLSAFVPNDTANAVDVLNKEFDSFRSTRILIVDIDEAYAQELYLSISRKTSVRIFIFDINEHFRNENALFNIVFNYEATQEDFESIIQIIENEGFEIFIPQPLYSDSLNVIQQYMPLIIILAIIIILIVLIITTSSYFVPVIFLMTFVVAIFINIGTNFWFGAISLETLLITPLIQLLLGIDFANILNNCFEEEKGKYNNKEEAMIHSIKKAIPEIVTAGSTTVLGFLALAVMTLGIGQDLGLVLGKGILISIITTLTLLPALLLVFLKITDKTQHERFNINVRPLARFSIKYRFILMPLFLITATAFSFFALTANYYFSESSLETSTSTENQIAINKAQDIFGYGNQIIILIPNDDISTHQSLYIRISQLDNHSNFITSIISIYSHANIEQQLIGPTHTMMIVNFDLPTEANETFNFIESLIDEVTYITPEALFAGESVRLFHIKSSFSGDYQLITMITFFVLLGVLLLMFKRVNYPILLTIIIQLVILMNFGISYVLGNKIFYMTMILVVAVQKAFTFDYAVVLASRYEILKNAKKPHEAMEDALQEAYPNIIASGTIISVLCFIITLIVNHPMISQFTLTLAFGALLAVAFVSLILPGILFTVAKPTNKEVKDLIS